MGKTKVGQAIKKLIQDDINQLRGELEEVEAKLPQSHIEKTQWKKDREELKKDIRLRETQVWLLDKLVVVGASLHVFRILSTIRRIASLNCVA